MTPRNLDIDPTLQLIDIAAKMHCSEIADYVFKDERFPIWSGSSKPNQHHYGKGGLAQHTLEVVQLCLENAEYYAEMELIDNKTLFLAALFHDTGKMWDYEPVFTEAHVLGVKPDNGRWEYNLINHGTEWRGSIHKRRIHHISRSAIFWNHVATITHTPELCVNGVTHAILAHHGHREYGSPVSPNTRVAWLLHLW